MINVRVVSNSSPLIILYKCDQLHLLERLFGHVFIPEAVRKEVIHSSKDPHQSEAISRCDFIKARSIPQSSISFSRKLDRGEQEALILASALKADYLLLDDKRAQKEANDLQIPFIPTLAVLLKASQKGIISDFEALLSELEQKMVFLTRELSLEVRNFLNPS